MRWAREVERIVPTSDKVGINANYSSKFVGVLDILCSEIPHFLSFRWVFWIDKTFSQLEFIWWHFIFQYYRHHHHCVSRHRLRRYAHLTFYVSCDLEKSRAHFMKLKRKEGGKLSSERRRKLKILWGRTNRLVQTLQRDKIEHAKEKD